MRKIWPFILALALVGILVAAAWAGDSFQGFNQNTAPVIDFSFALQNQMQSGAAGNSVVNNLLAQANSGNVIAGNIIDTTGSIIDTSGGAGGVGGSGGGTGGVGGNGGSTAIDGGNPSFANITANLSVTGSLNNVTGVAQSGQVAGIMNNQVISIAFTANGAH